MFQCVLTERRLNKSGQFSLVLSLLFKVVHLLKQFIVVVIIISFLAVFCGPSQCERLPFRLLFLLTLFILSIAHFLLFHLVFLDHSWSWVLHICSPPCKVGLPRLDAPLVQLGVPVVNPEVQVVRPRVINPERVPVVPLSLAGIEKHPGFKNSIPLYYKMAYGVLYGDLMMTLANQTRPYEIKKGSADALCKKWTDKLVDELTHKHLSYSKVKKNYDAIIKDFAAVEREQRKAVKVGIVGEIYVKFSPLGNNKLEEFLVGEGAEVVMPGLADFFNYCLYNGVMDYKLYGHGKIAHVLNKIGFNFLCGKQADQIKAIKKEGTFRAMTPFKHTVELAEGFIGYGTKMGEGWLLVAEMLELADSGVPNIVCTQPFGCLPNHICGKGMMKPIKEAIPDANIVAIDYDAGASAVNQENRLKLMLAAARENLK